MLDEQYIHFYQVVEVLRIYCHSPQDCGSGGLVELPHLAGNSPMKCQDVMASKWPLFGSFTSCRITSTRQVVHFNLIVEVQLRK